MFHDSTFIPQKTLCSGGAANCTVFASVLHSTVVPTYVGKTTSSDRTTIAFLIQKLSSRAVERRTQEEQQNKENNIIIWSYTLLLPW